MTLKSWTKEEDVFLSENALKGIDFLMENIDRPRNAIFCHLRTLGLKTMSGLPDSADSFIRDNYLDFSWLEMGRELGVTPKRVEYRAKQIGLSKSKQQPHSGRKTKYQVNKSYFSVPDIENSYWAGFIAADGCLQVGNNGYRCKIALQSLDKWHLERFAYDVFYTGPVLDYRASGYGGTLVSILTINQIKDWHLDLEKNFNITPSKTLTLIGPNITDFDLCMSYIKGLIDGDGSIISNKKKGLSFSITGTYKLLSFVKTIIDSNFVYYGYHKKSSTVFEYKERRCAQYAVQGRRALEILKYMQNLSTPYLDRKWSKV